MKAVLEFDLDNPDDQMAHMRCVKARDMALVIWDIEQQLRRWMKESEDDILLAGTVVDVMSHIIQSHEINLDELIN